MTVTLAQIKPLIEKLEDTSQSLTASDRAKLTEIMKSSGATIATLAEQNDELQATLQILMDTNAAQSTARRSVINSIRNIAPPAASIDVEKALKDAEQLRKDIETANSVTKTAIAGLRFGVKLAGKFI